MSSLRIKALRAAAPAVVTMLLAAFPALAAAPATATIWTVAGNGTPCTAAPLCGDGGPATEAQFNFPESVAADAAGNLYVADWGDNELRKVSAAGVISQLAGDGAPCAAAPSCGDGGAAADAQLNFPQALAVDSAGNVYVADTGDNEVRRVSPRGVITRIAGDGAACSTAPTCGDGGAATRATLNAPGGVVVDSAGNVYVADTGDNEVRKVSTHGVITRVAGTGKPCPTSTSCGDGAAATSARLNLPEGLALDSSGRLYVVDDADNEVRRISGGKITRFAGTGVACAGAPACGDGRAATAAQLNLPEGVAVSPSGSVYIADWGDGEIRAVSRTGIISTAAGYGPACSSPPACGDGGSATHALLNAPQGVAVDSAGNLVIADTQNQELRLVTPAGSRPAPLRGGRTTVSLLAFQAVTTRSRVTMRYLLTGPASVVLSVRRSGGRPLVVARSAGHGGLGALVWNRKLGHTAAPAGAYQLTVTVAVGKASASSTRSVRL
jgi:sugar lactone lactonase YvrE